MQVRKAEKAPDAGLNGADGDAVVEEARAESGRLMFDPIDARYLSSATLVQSRLIKLLKHSKNHMHIFRNLLMAIVSLLQLCRYDSGLTSRK